MIPQERERAKVYNSLCKSYPVSINLNDEAIFLDLGGGFDLEISGTYSTAHKRNCTVYLWYEKQFIVDFFKIRKSRISDIVEYLQDRVQINAVRSAAKLFDTDEQAALVLMERATPPPYYVLEYCT